MPMYEQFKAREECISAEVLRFVTKSAALAWLLAFLHRKGLLIHQKQQLCGSSRLPVNNCAQLFSPQIWGARREHDGSAHYPHG